MGTLRAETCLRFEPHGEAYAVLSTDHGQLAWYEVSRTAMSIWLFGGIEFRPWPVFGPGRFDGLEWRGRVSWATRTG